MRNAVKIALAVGIVLGVALAGTIVYLRSQSVADYDKEVTLTVAAGDVLVDPLPRSKLLELQVCDSWTEGYPVLSGGNPDWDNGDVWRSHSLGHDLVKIQPFKDDANFVHVICSSNGDRAPLNVIVRVTDKAKRLPPLLADYPHEFDGDYLYPIPHPENVARIDAIETLVAAGQLEITATNVAYLATEVAEDE